MKIKTSELAGAALDWAVANCEGHTIAINYREYPRAPIRKGVSVRGEFGMYRRFKPSESWLKGGPIIEREKIELEFASSAPPELAWRTNLGGLPAGAIKYFSYGPAPLIAAMRCFVASRLGDEVEIPEELTGEKTK